MKIKYIYFEQQHSLRTLTTNNKITMEQERIVLDNIWLTMKNNVTLQVEADSN